MGELRFAVVGARAEPFAAAPQLSLQVRIDHDSDEPVHALALRCQVQIEPRPREYSAEEAERLVDLFGERERWPQTQRGAVLWAHASCMAPRFERTTQVDLPVPCTYDFEVAAAKYLGALAGGEVPLRLLFNGTAFSQGGNGFRVEPVAWACEATYRLPVAVYRDVMDRFFPNSAWLRLRRDSFDALARFRSGRGLPSWEEAIEVLLDAAGDRERV